jgi:hypothetical protein
VQQKFAALTWCTNFKTCKTDEWLHIMWILAWTHLAYCLCNVCPHITCTSYFPFKRKNLSFTLMYANINPICRAHHLKEVMLSPSLSNISYGVKIIAFIMQHWLTIPMQCYIFQVTQSIILGSLLIMMCHCKVGFYPFLVKNGSYHMM